MTEDSVRTHYDLASGEYDRRWAHYLRASLGPVRTALGESPRVPLLDVACGTGVLLERLSGNAAAESATDLIGMDVSPGMLRVASARLASRGTLVAADAARLPFAGASFRSVVSTSALRHWPRPAQVLAEMARVSTPGARLVLSDWDAAYLPTRLLDLYLRLTESAHHRALTHVEAGDLVAAAGFRIDEIRRHRDTLAWGFFVVSATRR